MYVCLYNKSITVNTCSCTKGTASTTTTKYNLVRLFHVNYSTNTQKLYQKLLVLLVTTKRELNWKTWIKKLNQQQLTIQLNFIWWWCIVVFIFSLGSLIPLKCSILIARPDVYNRSLLVVFCSCFNLKPPFPTWYKSRSGAYTKYLLLIRWIVYPVCCRFCILLLFFLLLFLLVLGSFSLGVAYLYVLRIAVKFYKHFYICSYTTIWIVGFKFVPEMRFIL